MRIKDVVSSDFVKSILTLSSGIVISQGIAVVGTPITSRIYAPVVVGDYAMIVSVATIIGVMTCLGMMTAIMLPDKDEEARGLCRLIAISLITISMMIVGVLIAAYPRLRAFKVSIPYRTACLLLYVYVVVTNVGHICYAYVNRLKHYRVLFWNPIFASLINLVFGSALGLLGCGFWGYAVSNILAQALVDFHMIRQVNPFASIDLEEYGVCRLLAKYLSFPKYQLPANIISIFAQQLPVQMVSRMWGSVILGYYFMSTRILQVPVSLIATPVNRVYYREAAKRYANGESIGEFSFRILKSNILLAIVPTWIITIFGEPFFAFAFGEAWRTAGNYASILGVQMMFSFCAICLSGNFTIIGRQRVNLALSVFSVALNLMAFVFGKAAFGGDVTAVLAMFTATNAAFIIVSQGLFLMMTGVAFWRYFGFVGIYIALPLSTALLIRSFL